MLVFVSLSTTLFAFTYTTTHAHVRTRVKFVYLSEKGFAVQYFLVNRDFIQQRSMATTTTSNQTGSVSLDQRIEKLESIEKVGAAGLITCLL